MPKMEHLQFCLQFRENIDCHSQALSSAYVSVFLSKQEKIQRYIEKLCQFNGNFNRAGLQAILYFGYVGSTDIYLFGKLFLGKLFTGA